MALSTLRLSRSAAAEGPTGEDRLANLDELFRRLGFDREHPGGIVVDFLEDISLASAVDRWKDDMVGHAHDPSRRGRLEFPRFHRRP